MKQTLYARRDVLLWGGLSLLILIPLFLWLGFWQLGKAETKLARQAELESRSRASAAELPDRTAAAEELRYRRFVLSGEYDGRHQVLVDNRVHDGQAGYHVLTPFRLAGSDQHVLVNRGWVPAGADRNHLPDVVAPTGRLRLTGVAVVPPARFFTLGDDTAGGRAGPAVWQNPDLERFRDSVGYPLQPVIIQLDPDSPGGYVRDWPRMDENADHNLGYAVQWFAFALLGLGLWLHFLIRSR